MGMLTGCWNGFTIFIRSINTLKESTWSLGHSYAMLRLLSELNPMTGTCV